jgi:hypothetical protein
MNKTSSLLMKHIIVFFILIGCIFVDSASAQNISIDRVGDFEFKIVDKTGWKSSPESSAHVENIFRHEGVKLAPSFAFTNSYGSLVFGAVKKLRDGLTFSADQLSSNVPQFPEAWGIKNNDVQNSSGRTDQGLEFAVMRVSGPGDGKIFGKGKLYKTLGVWIDIPVQYQDLNGYHSVLISLFYRGYDSKRPSDENFLRSIMNSIAPIAGVSIITEKKYKAQFQTLPDEAVIVNKSEPQKVDPPQKPKVPEPTNIYLLDIVKSINLAAKREISPQSSISPNSLECENLELVNEQDVSLVSLMKVVEANYAIYHKCAATLKSRPPGVLKVEPIRR